MLLLLLCYGTGSHCQVKLFFKPLRYEEDYSFLKEDTSRQWLETIKYIPVLKSRSIYLSLGGEVRYQYFYVKNEDWGEAPKDTDGYVLTRCLTHMDIHAGKRVRTFIQLQSSLANGKAVTSPVEENPLDLHQAFVDIDLNTAQKEKLLLRLGRQEMSYGSQRLIAVREGPNNRQSFDALKVVCTAADLKLDLFHSYYVAARKGLLDDRFSPQTKVWGAYLVKSNTGLLPHIDLYYLGLRKKKATFDQGQAQESRHSVGGRVWGKYGRWVYDAEGVCQFGKFDGNAISAWTLSLNTIYKIEKLKYKPELGLKTELISGDKAYTDKKLNTFNPLFPKGAYFGLAALIGPANLLDLHPSVRLELRKKLCWDIDYDVFWRHSTRDGLYAVNMSLLYSGKNISDALIGQQFSTDLEYTPNVFLYFRTEFTWFNTGSFLTKAGAGKDILFAGFTAQLKF
jgi:hypothetical protein